MVKLDRLLQGAYFSYTLLLLAKWKMLLNSISVSDRGLVVVLMYFIIVATSLPRYVIQKHRGYLIRS